MLERLRTPWTRSRGRLRHLSAAGVELCARLGPAAAVRLVDGLESPVLAGQQHSNPRRETAEESLIQRLRQCTVSSRNPSYARESC